MAQLLLELAVSGSRKADGSPNAGGRVFCYQIGAGTVKQTVYRDWQKLAAHTQPITLDGAGKAEIWVDAPCTLRVENSLGVALHNITAGVQSNAGLVEVTNAGFNGVDPDTGSIAAGERIMLDTLMTRAKASFGGQDWKFRGTYGTVDRTVKSEIEEVWISVKRFGAVGNGTADDTSAAQQAINAAVAAGGGTVYFPPGTYLLSSALTITSAIRILGAGQATTLLKQSSTTANVLTYSGTGTLIVENLGISASTTSTGAAISDSAGGLQIISVDSNGFFRTGVLVSAPAKFVSLINTNFSGNLADASSIGVSVTSTSTVSIIAGTVIGRTGLQMGAAAVGPLYIIGAFVLSSAGIALDIDGAAGVYVSGSSLSGTTSLDVANVAAVIKLAATDVSGAVNDGRAGTPVTFSVGTTTSVTPLPWSSDESRILGTAGGITVTINAPADAVHGMRHTIICSNTSGGAVTWTFNAAFVTSGAVAPATGNRVNLLFEYNRIDDKWYEVSRAATAN